jgi:hypothetical protein
MPCTGFLAKPKPPSPAWCRFSRPVIARLVASVPISTTLDDIEVTSSRWFSQ